MGLDADKNRALTQPARHILSSTSIHIFTLSQGPSEGEHPLVRGAPFAVYTAFPVISKPVMASSPEAGLCLQAQLRHLYHIFLATIFPQVH